MRPTRITPVRLYVPVLLHWRFPLAPFRYHIPSCNNSVSIFNHLILRRTTRTSEVESQQYCHGPRLECDRPYCRFQIAVGGGAALTLSEAVSFN